MLCEGLMHQVMRFKINATEVDLNVSAKLL